jgi:four helix bundle protein
MRMMFVALIFIIPALTLILNPSCMFDFQNLEVYKKAKIFYRESKRLISENNFSRNVNDQLLRASFSIVLNIAEGSGRFSKADRRNFFVIARGSVFECVAILDVLNDENLIDEKKFTDFLSKADELSRILFAMIKNLNS